MQSRNAFRVPIQLRLTLSPWTAWQPENVLLDDRGNVKLTGFALAGIIDPLLGNDVTNLLHATCGTPEYTAPEVRRDAECGAEQESTEQNRTGLCVAAGAVSSRPSTFSNSG